MIFTLGIRREPMSGMIGRGASVADGCANESLKSSPRKPGSSAFKPLKFEVAGFPPLRE